MVHLRFLLKILSIKLLPVIVMFGVYFMVTVSAQCQTMPGLCANSEPPDFKDPCGGC